MYRTHRTHELILKGLPEKYRGEMWMLFSGAQNEVSVLNFIYGTSVCRKSMYGRSESIQATQPGHSEQGPLQRVNCRESPI